MIKAQTNSSPSMFKATIQLNFSAPLIEDTDGWYAIFYAEHYNSPDAECHQTGKTYGCDNPITIEVDVPAEGTDFVFKGIGLSMAQYVEVEKTIYPDDPEHSEQNDVWLTAAYETVYY